LGDRLAARARRQPARRPRQRRAQPRGPMRRPGAATGRARGASTSARGSASALESLDAGRRRGRARRSCAPRVFGPDVLLGVRSCSLFRNGLRPSRHVGTRPAAAPSRCITGGRASCPTATPTRNARL